MLEFTEVFTRSPLGDGGRTLPFRRWGRAYSSAMDQKHSVMIPSKITYPETISFRNKILMLPSFLNIIYLLTICVSYKMT